jgi:hypothetical protein
MNFHFAALLTASTLLGMNEAIAGRSCDADGLPILTIDEAATLSIEQIKIEIEKCAMKRGQNSQDSSLNHDSASIPRASSPRSSTGSYPASNPNSYQGQAGGFANPNYVAPSRPHTPKTSTPQYGRIDNPTSNDGQTCVASTPRQERPSSAMRPYCHSAYASRPGCYDKLHVAEFSNRCNATVYVSYQFSGDGEKSFDLGPGGRREVTCAEMQKGCTGSMNYNSYMYGR